VAGSGIGRASALNGLPQEGAAVLAVGRRDANTEETVERIRAAGGRAGWRWWPTPPTSPTCRPWWPAAWPNSAALDVFFANAGSPGTNAGMLEQTVEEWQTVWRDNVLSSRCWPSSTPAA
jgi:NAD(P)-dependent dehydrogenase (short-subunit alcohol dehydrogenase family)